MRRLTVLVLAAVATVSVGIGRAEAQPMQLLISLSPGQAAADTTTSVFAHVYLAFGDGMPKADAPVSPPAGGLPSEWTIQTLSVPPAMTAPCTQRVRNATQTAAITGELRVLRISRQTNNAKDPAAGLYTIELAPVSPCGNGVFIKWLPGEYHFMLAYTKGNGRGTALATLTIR